MFHKPASYHPIGGASEKETEGLVTPYLTNVLLPQIHNGLETQKPFSLTISQEGINKTVAWWCSQETAGSEKTQLSSPAVLFVEDSLVLMSTVNFRGAEFVVSAEVSPVCTSEGKMNLIVQKVKVGAVNITIPTRIIAKKMYRQHLAEFGADFNDIRAEIAASLFNNQAFDPVFEIKNIVGTAQHKVRIKEVEVTKGKLQVRLEPL